MASPTTLQKTVPGTINLHTIEYWEKLSPPKEILPHFLIKCDFLLVTVEAFEDNYDPGNKTPGEADNF